MRPQRKRTAILISGRGSNMTALIAAAANPDVPAGTVVQVVQPGYSIGERVLRPAMVGVAKGGPKQAAGEAPVEPGPVNEQAEKDA